MFLAGGKKISEDFGNVTFTVRVSTALLSLMTLRERQCRSPDLFQTWHKTRLGNTTHSHRQIRLVLEHMHKIKSPHAALPRTIPGAEGCGAPHP